MRLRFSPLTLLVLLIGVHVAQAGDQTQRSLLQEGGPTKKWSPGYVSSTLADALADVLRAKAEYKYAKPETVQVANIAPAVPSKSKDFTFTNIRLRTSATGGEDTNNPGGMVASTGYHPSPVTTTPPSPFTTQPAAAVPAVPAQSNDGTSDIAKKLEEYKRLTEEMQKTIEAMKQQQAAAPVGRKLQDADGPGWDYGALLEKKLELLQQEADALHLDLQNDLAAKMDLRTNKMDKHQAAMGVAMDSMADRWASKSDTIQNAVDAWRDHKESSAGNLQDTLARLMEMKTERKIDKWNNNNWFG